MTAWDLVMAASAGFGSVKVMSEETGVPLRTLNNLKLGKYQGTCALIFLMMVFAANPDSARRIAKSARDFGGMA